MLRIGVLGAGHLGKIHLKCWQQVPEVEIVGFYDHDESVRKQVSESLHVRAFDQASSLMEVVDAIDIVVPTVAHYDYAEEAIAQGKHLFIEKPIAHTLPEAEALLQLIEATSLVGQVGHVERFNPAFLAVADRGLNPMFVEGHRLAQYNPRGTDVSVVLDLMIHDLDVILHVIQAEVKEIQASGVAVVSDTPDIANARISFDNGCIANLTASRISMKNMRKLRFFQKDTYVAVDFLQKQAEYLHLLPDGQSPERGVPLPIETGTGTRYLTIEQPEVQANNAILQELTEFAAAIKHGTPVRVPFRDGVRALRVAYEILAQIQRGLSELPTSAI